MNYKRITVATLAVVAALICALLAIGVLSATVKNESFAESSALGEQLTSLKEDLASCEEIIANAEATITENQEKLPPLEEKRSAAQAALDKANKELDKVCTRNYYSSWCDEEADCKKLHDKVSSANANLSPITQELDSCRSAIESANEEIKDAKSRITRLETEIEEVSSEKTKAFFGGLFVIIAMFIAIAGLVALIKFLLNREEKKIGLIACALMAAASLIYAFLDTLAPGFTYLFSIVIFGIFASLISGNAENRVALRVITIILSIAFLFTALVGGPIIVPLYVFAMILISLVLVPCVFTEYLDIAKHIFFNIITLGIWQLIWIYNVTENLNKVEEAEKRAPVRELLLYLFLPLYYIFWTYKTAEITQQYGAEKEKQFKIDVLCLAFSFVSPLIPSIVIQDKTNTIVGKPVEVAEEVKTETEAETV